VRALVVSDLHFGAWTGDDLLAHPLARQRLAPHLEGLDELVLLGDVFDLLFARTPRAFTRADAFFGLVAEKLAGRRIVWLAGNHDHHFVVRPLEQMVEAGLAGEPSPPAAFIERFLRHRLPGVECSIAYPTHRVGDVLLCHGHYLDAHVKGSLANRLLTRGLWSIAGGRPQGGLEIADYEASMIPLTELLYTVAQLPHGTNAQEGLLDQVRHLGRIFDALAAPGKEARRVFERIAARVRGDRGRPRAPEAQPVSTDIARAVGPDEPVERSLHAYGAVVRSLGWDGEADQFVFSHTHQPLDGVTIPGMGARFWNTGCWIYEPTLASEQTFERYGRIAWPGTAVLVDTEEPAPRLLRLLEDLNPGPAGYDEARRLGGMRAPGALGAD